MWPSLVLLCALAMAAGTRAQALELRYEGSMPLHDAARGLTEPSGLAADPSGTVFWVVSDSTDTVYRLGADGTVAAVTGRDRHLRDLEGIAVDAANDRLLAVSERDASVVAIGLAPPHRIRAHKVAEMASPEDLGPLLKDRRNGLEGITLDPVTGTVLVVKETEPSLLIEISPTLDHVIAVQRLEDRMEGVGDDGDDVSGLAMDAARNGLWIVSDRGKSVHFLPRDGTAAQRLPLSWLKDGTEQNVDNAEGVTLSPDGATLFVVSDDGAKSRLFRYAIEGG